MQTSYVLFLIHTIFFGGSPTSRAAFGQAVDSSRTVRFFQPSGLLRSRTIHLVRLVKKEKEKRGDDMQYPYSGEKLV